MIALRVEHPLRLHLVELGGVAVTGGPAGHAALEREATARRAAHAGAAPGSIPGVDRARRLFRSAGIDPTKTRPSSEALLRRALAGKPMPRVNDLVDVVNAWSLAELLPVGLYDRARIAFADPAAPEVVARLGRAGEACDALNGRRVSVEGRLALFDAEGPFGTPAVDSVRTAITTGTRDAIAIVWAPEDEDPDALAAAARRLATAVGAP